MNCVRVRGKFERKHLFVFMPFQLGCSKFYECNLLTDSRTSGGSRGLWALAPLPRPRSCRHVVLQTRVPTSFPRPSSRPSVCSPLNLAQSWIRSRVRPVVLKKSCEWLKKCLLICRRVWSGDHINSHRVNAALCDKTWNRFALRVRACVCLLGLHAFQNAHKIISNHIKLVNNLIDATNHLQNIWKIVWHLTATPDLSYWRSLLLLFLFGLLCRDHVSVFNAFYGLSTTCKCPRLQKWPVRTWYICVLWKQYFEWSSSCFRRSNVSRIETEQHFVTTQMPSLWTSVLFRAKIREIFAKFVNFADARIT